MQRNRHHAAPSTPDLTEPPNPAHASADRSTTTVNWAAVAFMAAYALGILAAIVDIMFFRPS